MEDEEELEPLFDYTRVQPTHLSFDEKDADPDSSPCFSGAKRRKCDGSAIRLKGDEENKFISVDDDAREEDEEDWLPPPPQEIVDSSLDLPEDETIRELRLKKKELESFARSGEDVMKAVIESIKKDLKSSAKSDDLDDDDDVKKVKHVDRPKILISIQAQDGLQSFRVYKDDKFERLFKMYAEWAKVDFERLAFCFDGEKVNTGSTPEVLGLEDDDIIEVHVKKSS